MIRDGDHVKKVLVTGAAGMLGTDLCASLKPVCQVVGADIRAAVAPPAVLNRIDLTEAGVTEEFFLRERPEVVFHAAAMTHVDGCEKDPALAERLNVGMTQNVVAAANRVGAFVVFFSSDYVFDGTGKTDYAEEDRPHPCNVYGQTKMAAEDFIRDNAVAYMILRISWLFGQNGPSFPRTILEKAPTADQFEIVADQIGRPTYTKDLARALADLISNFDAKQPIIHQQIFHLANSGATSWADFAEWILENSHGKRPPVRRIPTPEGHRPAVRPKYSVLSTKKAEARLGIRLRSWQDAVRDFIQIYESETKHVATK